MSISQNTSSQFRYTYVMDDIKYTLIERPVTVGAKVQGKDHTRYLKYDETRVQQQPDCNLGVGIYLTMPWVLVCEALSTMLSFELELHSALRFLPLSSSRRNPLKLHTQGHQGYTGKVQAAVF